MFGFCLSRPIAKRIWNESEKTEIEVEEEEEEKLFTFFSAKIEIWSNRKGREILKEADIEDIIWAMCKAKKIKAKQYHFVLMRQATKTEP